jgi:hypothetical protein
MRRKLFAAFALAGLLGLLAPAAASASEQVCNWGGQVELQVHSGLPVTDLAAYGPATITRNQVIVPPGQVGKNVALTCEP